MTHGCGSLLVWLMCPSCWWSQKDKKKGGDDSSEVKLTAEEERHDRSYREVQNWLKLIMAPHKEEVGIYSRVVLNTMSYDLNVNHPFRALRDHMDIVGGESYDPRAWWPKRISQALTPPI
jgi:hypothetical protein